ncbi:hypothetical protein FRB90_012447, partial [Tulasnella sp. 427]
MALGGGSSYRESTTAYQITFEWSLMGLKEIFESAKDDERSPLITSEPFGGGKWQLHFYASAGRDQASSSYLAAVPTLEERWKAAQGGGEQTDSNENGRWTRSGPFSFTFEVKSLDGTIPIVAHGPHEPMVREEFGSDAYTWGYPQYVRRDEIYDDRPSVVED